MTELWADGAPKLEILSSAWKSMVEQERLDKPNAAFVTELRRRLVRALQAGTKGGAAFIGTFLSLFLWQGGNFFRCNRPVQNRPEAPPAELRP